MRFTGNCRIAGIRLATPECPAGRFGGGLLLGIAVLASISFMVPADYRPVRQESFGLGERMEFRVHYGLLNAGEAVMQADTNYHYFNGRPCYKLEITGRSVGVFDLITTIRDTWGTYLDTAAIVPHRFYQYIEEGRYRKKEIIDFDHARRVATAHRLDRHSGELLSKADFKVPYGIQDLVSGYYYLRTLDFASMKVNDVFPITGFFDDTTYVVEVRYLGMERLKTRLGDFESHVISPIMPKNRFFRGRNPVRAWISADRKKIPLKVRADLIVGGVEIDIRSYQPMRR
jgi:hypothetical protein